MQCIAFPFFFCGSSIETKIHRTPIPPITLRNTIAPINGSVLKPSCKPILLSA